MTRSVLVGSLSVLGILASFTGCQAPESVCGFLPDGGKGDPEYLTSGPQACADRASLGFAREFGSGTFIGVKPQDTLTIRNGGIADLAITSATYNGDPAFTLTTEPATLPANITGNKYFYMRVVFAPTEAKLYTGKITVLSNAENTPTREFEISGCGVPMDGGSSPCYLDGGVP